MVVSLVIITTGSSYRSCAYAGRRNVNLTLHVPHLCATLAWGIKALAVATPDLFYLCEKTRIK